MNSDLPRDPCEPFAEELSHFVLGELADDRRPALERHLVACAACRAERDLLARSVELLKHEGGATAPLLELSEARRANLLAQAAATTTTTTGAVRRSWWSAPRLAAAAALLLGVTLGGRSLWGRFDGTRADDGLVARRVAFDANLDEKFAAASIPDAAAGSSLASDGFALSDTVASHTPLSDEPQLMTMTRPDEAVAAPTNASSEVKLVAADVLEAIRALGYGDESGSKPAPPAGASPAPRPSEPTTSGAPSPSTVAPAGKPTGPAPQPPVAGGSVAGRGRAILTGRTKAEPSPATGGGRGAAPSPSPTAPLPEAELSELRMLGYLGGDGAEVVEDGVEPASGIALWAHPGSPPDGADHYRKPGAGAAAAPGALAAALADSNAPSEVLAFQPRLVASLGFDPNTPMDGDAGRRTDDVVREFLNRLAPRQGETPRDMFFRYFGDHPFVSTRIDCKSTFGMDVDSASYNLVRAYLTKGNLPPKAAVRTEEFVNSFRHDLAPPPFGAAEVFAIHTELAPSPFGEQGQLLLQIGLKAREIRKESRRAVALTFVIDVSGSMEEGGRLELVKRSLRMLVDQLDERDTIGIVVFSTNGRRVLDPTSAVRRGLIYSTLDTLRPDGSTNADAGLRLGYEMALEQLRPEAENRVILCSDGVANTGVTDVNWLVARIRECKSKHIYLNCVGVGMNNHNDALLEQLADEGDGSCAYVDRDEEAKEIFVDKLSGTLTTVARNAKVQVEFDPKSVRRFRQLGYENRALAHQDFRNDRIDAGEVGAGHEVVALYEVELQADAVGPLATIRCRYEEPRSSEVIEQARVLFAAEMAASVQRASPRFRLSAAVAEFAEILRQSIHARAGSLADVQRFAEPLIAELPGDPDVPEFVALVKQAARLPDLLPRRNELVRAVDELKRLRCWQEELRGSDAARDEANAELMRQLEEQNRKLGQALRDALERAARGS